MKTTYLSIIALIAPFCCHAQTQARNDQSPGEKPLFEEITKIKKKTDKFNLYLDMHSDFDAEWTGSHFDEGKFQMRQLRIEMKGQINDWLSYRYRQRLNYGDNTNGYRDNVLKSIDFAMVGFRANKVTFYVGKQCAAYGGIEFDLNPIEIYQYSDLGNNGNSFSTGVNVSYNATKSQQIQFQVLNSYIGSITEEYGDYQKAKLPLVYILNWNGNFNDVFKTRWSTSIMNQAKGKHTYYFALGNEFNISEKFGGYFDWMYSLEGIDRRGVMTTILEGDEHDRNASKVSYMAYVLHLDYRILPKWSLFATGTYDQEGVFKAHDGIAKGTYRKVWGWVGGIEYFPFNDRNLHFFVAYSGRSYKYTKLAREYGWADSNTNRLAVGFIWQMPIF